MRRLQASHSFNALVLRASQPSARPRSQHGRPAPGLTPSSCCTARMAAWESARDALKAEVEAEADWSFQCCYADEGVPDLLMGFTAVHGSGMAVDVIWMPVVPQGLIWANTPLESDQGATH